MEYTFSDNLKRIRKEQGLSQKELADMVGVAQNTICAWETNERYPTVDRLYDLANALKSPINALVGANSEVTV